MKRKGKTLLFLFLSIRVIAQIPQVQVPQPATLSPQSVVGYPNQQNNNVRQQNQQDFQRQRQRQSELQQILAEAENDFKPKTILYELPYNTDKIGTGFYHKAFDTINLMLDKKRVLNLKQAVFLTENAYYGQPVYFDWFSSRIEEYVAIIKQEIDKKGYDFNNVSARKWGIQHFLADTIQIKDEQGKIVYTHFPFTYDFHDIWGKEDMTKQFVSKLMSEGNGQCHSMPLLYLILAEALNVKDAWLSFSPSHTFVKVKDKRGNMINYEATNGQYTTDTWVQSSGFIKAEALRNKTYMDTLSKSETIATCLADLASGYIHKFGYDKFVLECTEKALKYSPNNVYALQIQANYQTRLFMYVINQLGRPPLKDLPKYPEAFAMYQKMQQNYQIIDAIGFEEMPENIYAAWLKSIETMKGLQPIKVIRP